MPIKWREVIEKDEYKALPDSEKAKAKIEYFYDVVAPQVPEDTINEVRSEFLKDTGRIEINQAKPSFIRDVVGKSLLKLPQRMVGIAVGAINSPLAFVWGSQQAGELDKEQYDKLPAWKQALVSTGAGVDSMLRSTFKEGDWGTLYGDYYKSVKGKTIEEDLPEGLKWSAPTVEFLANVISDPLIVSGAVKNLSRFKVPKEWMGKIPDKVVKDLQMFEKLDEAEKQVLKGKMLEAFNNRKDYMSKWQDTVAFTEQQHKIKQAEVVRKRGLKGGSLLTGERDPFSKMTAPRQAMVGQPKRDFGIQVTREEPALTKQIRTTPKLGKKGVSPEAISAMEKTNKFRAEKGLPPLGKVPVEKIREAERIKATQKIEAFRKTKGLSPLKLRAEGGALSGIEQDEEGNISYDPIKGMVGLAGAAAGVKIVDAFKNKGALKTLSKYPAWAKVASGIGKEKHIWTVPEVIEKLNIKLFERFAVLKRTSPETYQKARAFASYKDQALLAVRPLVEAFKPVRKDNFTISSYVKAHRDMTRAERGILNPGGVTLKDAKKAIQEIETEWVAKGKSLDDLQSTLDSFNQWTHDEILYPAYQAGFISKEAYNDIVKNNKWYATYDVIEHLPENIDNIPILTSKEYFSNANQSIIKSMKGTEKQIIDPIDATIKKFTLAQYSIARNKVASTLIDDPFMQGLIRPIATSKKEYAIMKNQGLNPFMQGGFPEKEWGTINRFKDGNVERWAVPKEIADSMKQLTIHQAPRILQAYNAVFRSTATTLSPFFLVRNLPRDFILGYVSSPYHTAVTGLYKYPYDWGRGAWEAIKHEIGKPSLVDDFVKGGGSFGWAGTEAFEGAGKEATKKMLFQKSLLRQGVDVVTSPFRLIAKANEIVEMAPRLGIFERGMKLGFTIEDAAMAGRQATIDFNRGGTWLKVANQYVPFLNARFQAKVTLYDAFKRDPKSTSAKMVNIVMIPGLAGYAWNRLYYSDEYDKIPEQIRQDNFCLIYGTKKDEKTGKIGPKYLTIAKGDAGTLFNPIEFAIDGMLKKGPESARGAKEFLINFLSDISPVEFARQGKVDPYKVGGSLVPPIAKWALEDWANLKFYQGTDVVPYWMEKTKPPELHYTEKTPEVYKWLATQFKDVPGPGFLKDPLRLQNVTSNLFTTYGRIGLSPKAMLDVMKDGTILRTDAYEIESRVFLALRNIEDGYNTTRAYVEKALDEGNQNHGIKLMNDWNNGLQKTIKEYNKEFSKYGYSDQGEINKSYHFTMIKRKNLLFGKEKYHTPFQKIVK